RIGRSGEVLFDDGVRNRRQLVEVVAEELALALEFADDLERNPGDVHQLPETAAILEHGLARVVAEHDDVGASLDLLGGEESAAGEVVAANLEQVVIGSEDERDLGVMPAVLESHVL